MNATESVISTQEKGAWLASPFPHISDHKLRWATAMLSGLVVFVFLSIYEPFGIAELKGNSPYVLGFGLCVSTSLLISFYLLPSSFAFFNPESWTIKTEIVFHVINLIITATFNYVYNSTIGVNISPQHSWFEFIYITLAVGIFPIFIMVFGSERYLSKANQTSADSLQDEISKPSKSTKEQLVLKSSVETEQPLVMATTDFLCAQSDNNYCTITHLVDSQITRSLLRISLRALMNQVGASSGIVRCHKSYAINKNRITKIKGNARSLHLYLTEIDTPIPVSRSFDRDLLTN